MNLELSVRDAVDARAEDVPCPGPKLDDRPGEQARRRRALGRVQAALAVEADVRAHTSEITTESAERAVWLGASLADLATVTGRSRQAARKRWPSLGPVSRRRRWLGHHVDEVLWAVRLIVDARAALPALDPEVLDELESTLATAQEALAREDVQDEEAVVRWQLLDRLVDHLLRAVVTPTGPADAPAEPTQDTAAFALHGARGVLGYYDHATTRAEEDG